MVGVVLPLTIGLSLFKYKYISQTIGDDAEPITGKGTKGNFFGFFEFYRSKKENPDSNQVFTLTPTSSNALDASVHHMAPEASRRTTILADTTCVILEVLMYVCMYMYIYMIIYMFEYMYISFMCAYRYIHISIHLDIDICMTTYFGCRACVRILIKCTSVHS